MLNWLIEHIIIKYLINDDAVYENDEVENKKIYIQASIERHGGEKIILPVREEDCVWIYEECVDYKNNLSKWEYKNITDKLTSKILSRIIQQ